MFSSLYAFWESIPVFVLTLTQCRKAQPYSRRVRSLKVDGVPQRNRLKGSRHAKSRYENWQRSRF